MAKDNGILFATFRAMLRLSRGGSRAAATCKMEHFLIIVLVMLPAMDSISVIYIYDLFELKSKVYLCISSQKLIAIFPEFITKLFNENSLEKVMPRGRDFINFHSLVVPL